MWVRSICVIAFGVFTIAFVGCGPSGPAIVPVSGTVKFHDGKPVTSGVIEFSPESGGPGARAKIGPDGSFTLKTGDRSGATVGIHKIVIVQVFLADGAAAHVGSNHTANVVHPKYAKFESSGLIRDVKLTGENNFQIIVDSASPSKKGW